MCLNFNFTLSKDEVCNECCISMLGARRDIHLLLFMHSFKDCEKLIYELDCTKHQFSGIINQIMNV